MASALNLLRDSLEAQGADVQLAEASSARNLAAALLVAVSSGNAGMVKRILAEARSIPHFIERNGNKAMEAAQRRGDRTITEMLNSALQGKHVQDDASESDYRRVDTMQTDTAKTPYKVGIGIDSVRGLWIHF